MRKFYSDKGNYYWFSRGRIDGGTALFIAARYVVREMMDFYSLVAAGMKAKNGFDALHMAAKQRELGKVT